MSVSLRISACESETGLLFELSSADDSAYMWELESSETSGNASLFFICVGMVEQATAKILSMSLKIVIKRRLLLQTTSNGFRLKTPSCFKPTRTSSAQNHSVN